MSAERFAASLSFGSLVGIVVALGPDGHSSRNFSAIRPAFWRSASSISLASLGIVVQELLGVLAPLPQPLAL